MLITEIDLGRNNWVIYYKDQPITKHGQEKEADQLLKKLKQKYPNIQFTKKYIK